MERAAFIFKIKPEMKEEYKKAHDNIWPELVELIKSSGIKNYSIYFHKSGTLFAYFETEDVKRAMSASKDSEVNARWQKYMDKFFINDDPEVVGAQMETLEEVFHID